MRSFGEVVAHLIRQRGWSQADFAGLWPVHWLCCAVRHWHDSKPNMEQGMRHR